ncbi:MAG: AsmA-like C-terminal region-containing protein [Rhodobacter sp.]|nr:AsmA-like C-terminal region-containing protein [Rhodobacter sp.]
MSEGITLTDFRGEFKAGAGLDGQFTAQVNGKAAIQGTVVPTRSGAAIRLVSDQAGAVLAAADVLRNARGGRMNLTLNPTGATGVYDGRLNITNTRIMKAPALTELISAISIVGLLDQMNSGGISLSEIEADFQLTPSRLTLYRSSAVGPSIGVSLDGIYDLVNSRMDMQGVLSPVYFLNGIGQIFSRGRDGLFGFNFRLSGDAKDPRVTVNPLSILTPGAFREIFRRPPPKPVPSQ